MKENPGIRRFIWEHALDVHRVMHRVGCAGGTFASELWRHNVDFVWDARRQEAFSKLKELVSSAPELHPIDYTSVNPVILSVDSLNIATGMMLSQMDDEGRRRPARYRSRPMSERESRYSQPKLELFGLYHALRS